ncbi:MAG TPA: serine/threonine-protein kinase [Polyangiaceae bacterium]|nr:serine/threonine-protein kinase [Polyangiaceae bacterium]
MKGTASPPPPLDFAGTLIESNLQPGIRYRLRRLLGEGGMGSVYFALCEAQAGSSGVAVKILAPDVVLAAGDSARLAIQKEAVALGRLNEQAPPTPYVVRLLDTGELSVSFRGRQLSLPWLALEYVHGGVDGTTLFDRVSHSRQHLQRAFAPERAARAIECIGHGLEAVHREGVIHRDLKPGNVLCAGFGNGEVFKISDFGIARPQGMNETFGSVLLGTPGYVAPEQLFPDYGEVGPWTDVFGFAALVFYVLTGEEYFRTKTPAHALMLAMSSERRRLTDCPGLCSELNDSKTTCEELDRMLRTATSTDPTERPASALLFARGLMSVLAGAPGPTSHSSAPASTVAPGARTKIDEWSVVRESEPGRLVRRAAWDGAGNCLALSNAGLEYWNGSGWLACRGLLHHGADSFSAIAPVTPGVWVLGGSAGRAMLYRHGDVAELLPAWNPEYTFTAVAGNPDDIAVFVAQKPGETLLVGMAARRWLRPSALGDVGAVSDLVRVSDTRWLVCGTGIDGSGFACTYQPLMWQTGELRKISGALIACAAQTQDHGLCLGLSGAAARVIDDHLSDQSAPGGPDFWSAALDSTGVAWGGGLRSLWQQSGSGQPWVERWSAPSFGAPFTSLFADVGRVVAITRDGGVLEGRRAP